MSEAAEKIATSKSGSQKRYTDNQMLAFFERWYFLSKGLNIETGKRTDKEWLLNNLEKANPEFIKTTEAMVILKKLDFVRVKQILEQPKKKKYA